MSKIQTAFRLEESMLEDLKTIAKKKDRSISSLVRVVLKNYIEQQNF